MTFLPIILGIGAPSDAEKGRSPPQKSVVEKVLKRDDFSCRFCGFRAKQYQRVIPCDEAGNPPFATACTFCEQCMMLERAGITGAGILIWLPEIAQAELNHIVRAIYVARAQKDKDSHMAAQATRALDALTARRAEAKKRLGSDDPLLLATIMHESLNDDERRQVATKIDGIRLLPAEKHMVRTSKGDVNHFPQIATYWCSKDGPFDKLPVERWAEMFKNAAATAEHA